MRPSTKAFFFAPALVLAAACSKDKPADATLSNDLTLAAQARQTATLDSISAAERTRAAVAAAPVAPAPTTAPMRTATHTSTVHHRSSSGSSSSGSSNGSSGGNRTVYSEPRTVTEKHTNRDAAIGAAAGAVIGGASSHSVKGGIIGAAAGGILGGIIGNNVDIKKKPVP